MTAGFLITFLLGFLATIWGDRKERQEAKKSEQALYWAFALLTAAGFLCSYTHMHIPMPTEVIVYKFAPWFHQFTRT